MQGNTKVKTLKIGLYITAFLLLLHIFGCSNNELVDQKNNIVSTETKKEDESNWPKSFEIGRAASEEEIAALDIDVRPDGEGLPEGSGSVALGKSIYLNKCATCHGTKVADGAYDRLFDYDRAKMNPDSLKKKKDFKTIGNYWPYATTLYDYINRAMPFNAPGSLTHQEIYNVIAYLLFANQLIDEGMIITASNLPKIKMPAQSKFVNDDRKGGSEVK